MKLPNADRAVIDEAKLENYCFDTMHPRGRHKAIVFKAAMNLGAGDSAVLAALLRERIAEDEVDDVEVREYGILYVLHFPIAGSAPARTLRHVWVIRNGEDYPRLVSSYLVRQR